MAEKPILFSTHMVQAILDGRKTQTRRVIKPQPMGNSLEDTLSGEWLKKDFGGLLVPRIKDLPMECPYQPGDRLWVRETWLVHNGTYYYKADNKHLPLAERGIRFKWKPAIFMPKTAARIWLTVTEVRVERLSEITEEDAIAEGIRMCIGGMPYFSCREALAALWNSLNAKRGHGWEQNPWVWAISFKKEE